jgi:hypothetical protein
VTQFRNAESLADAIEEVSKRRGRLDKVFIEKDYWVTQVLRALNDIIPGAFQLKGGTSLSKGYQLITRFSEDVDVVVIPVHGMSIADREAHLIFIKDEVASRLGLASREQRAPGHGRLASRGDYLSYIPVVVPEVKVDLVEDAVLLETGYSDGSWPPEMVDIRTMIGESLDVDENDYEDLAPFRIQALDAMRTLVEKLFAVHGIVSRRMIDGTNAERFGRHYYDVHCLLEHSATRTKLGRRAEFEAVVADVERISNERWGGTVTRPAGGFADSPAFAPPDGDLRRWIEAKYGESLSLVPPTSARPGFEAVLTTVRRYAALI